MALVKKRSTLSIWKDVIFAIFLREIRSKFNDKFGISWSIASPLVFIMALTLMRGSLDGGITHTMPTFFFMVYGILLVQLFITNVNSVSASIKSNKALFAFRQVHPISAVIAVGGLELLSKFFVAIVIIIIACFIGVEVNFYNALGILSIFFLVWLLATSIGMLFALARCYIPEVDKLRGLVMRPFLFISGAFFSLRDIPQDLWVYMTWNPVLHAIEYTRYYAYPMYQSIGVDINYLYISTLIIFFFSLCCYHALWKSAISR